MASASPSDGYSSTPGIPSHIHTENSIVKIPHILPRERVFPIQIGGELFKLSGASISSDAPSYFSQYFLCQIKRAEERGEDIGSSIRTLYIDRDPATFRDIALHLQGYHVKPRDGTHFVRLFADAQFYSLPKLISQLGEESIFISIGHREFQIPRDVLTDPANSPNYFSLGFALFFSQPDDLFPGLDREGLLRPPSILPPSVPNRNAETFADLLRLLRGYPVDIRDEIHRQELLRDARYFHFKGLEQRLIPHSITYNPHRKRYEIALRLENVQKSGLSVTAGDSDDVVAKPAVRWVNYARPYVDDRPAEMGRVFQDTRARVARLLEVIATKLNLPPTTQPLGLLMASGGAGSQPATPGNTPLSDDLVRVVFEPETYAILDGEDYDIEPNTPSRDEDEVMSATPGSTLGRNPRKRRRVDDGEDEGMHDVTVGSSWSVKTGQWRLRIQESKGGKSAFDCILVAVKLDA
ncbi:hypothetical protein PT974_02576 [Cladobotryum mycophilum]|uniref:Potassium channel tetramerisation-type BTB domain-containing protein n=1 Tax=Cladobotryum mycophilum TaxID=491253 RepID=A0ABR0SYJ6_9HYPO